MARFGGVALFMHMSRDKELNKPYKLLGDKLRSLREKLNESLAEVSGAVEIELETLDRIERGSERPSEDILLLLISHFSAKDHDADHLWHLAGYERSLSEPSGLGGESYSPQPAMMVLPIDARIIYTDTVHIMANNHGVVMNFLQNAGPNNQTIAVSRIGMSREHAQSVLELLQQTLAQSAPKNLTLPEQKTTQTKNPKKIDSK